MQAYFTFPFEKRTFALAAVALLAVSAHAASEADFQVPFNQFMQAQAGNEDAGASAVNGFNKLLAAEPANPVLMAYAGAALTMRATTTILPWKKMSYAEDGMAQIDKALALLTPAHDAVVQNGTPGVLETRFTAASTFLAVPGFMNRGARGAKLLNQVLESPLLAQAPLTFKASVWMRAAALATDEKRPQDARKYLGLVIEANAPQADAARAQLKALQS
jgi:hypothetical protein